LGTETVSQDAPQITVAPQLENQYVLLQWWNSTAAAVLERHYGGDCPIGESEALPPTSRNASQGDDKERSLAVAN